MIAGINDMEVAMFLTGIDNLRMVEALGWPQETVVNEDVSAFAEIMNDWSEMQLISNQFS